jgi:hypothetical protein
MTNVRPAFIIEPTVIILFDSTGRSRLILTSAVRTSCPSGKTVRAVYPQVMSAMAVTIAP